MDLQPVSGGTVGTGLTQGAGTAAPIAKPGPVATPNPGQVTAIIDAAVLSMLSQPDLARLVAVWEPAQTGQLALKTGELLQASIDAANAGDAVRALESVSELAGLDPVRAEALRSDPRIEPVRAQVDSLLARLANLAKLDAETRITEAARAVESGTARLPEWDARPEALLSIASQLLDAGGHVNSVHAAQVAQVVIDAAHWAPAAAAVVAPSEPPTRPAKLGAVTEGAVRFSLSRIALSKQARARLARLWRRAPLLVLMLAWLAVGIVGGLASWIQRRILPDAVPDGLTDAAFSLWGLGFVALVLFGFYMQVRNVRL